MTETNTPDRFERIYAERVLSDLMSSSPSGFTPEKKEPYLRAELEIPEGTERYGEAFQTAMKRADKIRDALNAAVNGISKDQQFVVERAVNTGLEDAPLIKSSFFVYAEPEKTTMRQPDQIRQWMREHRRDIELAFGEAFGGKSQEKSNER